MKTGFTAIICLLLCAGLLAGCSAGGGSTADFLSSAGRPAPGSVGGDWTVFALARGEVLPEGWSDAYQQALEALLLERDGLLSERKNTEYSRTILALRSLGADPTDFSGYDLTLPLADIEKTASQGGVAAALAILALDGLGREELMASYFSLLLSLQLPDGGFTTPGDYETDADVTAICLQALAHCLELPGGRDAADRALEALSALQQPDGSFINDNISSSETISQVIIALCELGLSVEDPRFVKDSSLTDALSAFALPDGSYCHTLQGETNLMATEQAMCALAAMYRCEKGLSPLYVFTEGDLPLTCTLTVSCKSLLGNARAEEAGLVPEDGVIFSGEAEFTHGESVFDLLRRCLRGAGIPMEYTSAPLSPAYIEGIANLYEFDFGDSSGWIYSVNGEFPGLSSSLRELKAGDDIVFEYVLEEVYMP